MCTMGKRVNQKALMQSLCIRSMIKLVWFRQHLSPFITLAAVHLLVTKAPPHLHEPEKCKHGGQHTDGAKHQREARQRHGNRHVQDGLRGLQIVGLPPRGRRWSNQARELGGMWHHGRAARPSSVMINKCREIKKPGILTRRSGSEPTRDRKGSQLDL